MACPTVPITTNCQNSSMEGYGLPFLVPLHTPRYLFPCVWSFVDGGAKEQSFYSESSTPIYFQVAGFWVMNTPQGIGWYKMAQNKVTRISVDRHNQLTVLERNIRYITSSRDSYWQLPFMISWIEISLKVMCMFSEKSYWHFTYYLTFNVLCFLQFLVSLDFLWILIRNFILSINISLFCNIIQSASSESVFYRSGFTRITILQQTL